MRLPCIKIQSKFIVSLRFIFVGGMGSDSHILIFLSAIAVTLNFGNKPDLLPKLSPAQITKMSLRVQKIATINLHRYKFLRL